MEIEFLDKKTNIKEYLIKIYDNSNKIIQLLTENINTNKIIPKVIISESVVISKIEINIIKTFDKNPPVHVKISIKGYQNIGCEPTKITSHQSSTKSTSKIPTTEISSTFTSKSTPEPVTSNKPNSLGTTTPIIFTSSSSTAPSTTFSKSSSTSSSSTKKIPTTTITISSTISETSTHAKSSILTTTSSTPIYITTSNEKTPISSKNTASSTLFTSSSTSKNIPTTSSFQSSTQRSTSKPYSKSTSSKKISTFTTKTSKNF